MAARRKCCRSSASPRPCCASHPAAASTRTGPPAWERPAEAGRAFIQDIQREQDIMKATRSKTVRTKPTGKVTIDAHELAALRAAQATGESERAALKQQLEGERGQRARFESEIMAIRRPRAFIEFELDGTIRFANENFLKLLDFALEDIAGKHHSMLISASQRESAEYRELWHKVARGEYQAGEFLYISKSGKEVWVQGYFSPTFDSNSKPALVVSYNTNVTAQVMFARQLQATVE